MNHLAHVQELIAGFAGHGERPAILAFQMDGMARWSYAELADAIHGLARGLVAAGLEPGERVLLLANNRPEWIAVALSVIQAGGVLVPLDSQFGGEVPGRILADAEPRFVFTSSAHVQTFEELEDQVAPQLFLLDVPEDDERSWCRLLRQDGDLPPVQADDPAMLFYTSGTTDPPLDGPLTHANLAFQINTLLDLTLIDHDERVLQPLPPNHVYPLNIGTLGPLAYGAPLVLPQALTGQQLLRAHSRGRGRADCRRAAALPGARRHHPARPPRPGAADVD
jgi:long-chain acyl-CoA synthetase